MAIVRRQFPDAELHVVGAPKRAGDEGVQFHGLVTDVEVGRLLNQCSVFCMPAICETWGIVYTEAADAGLPIVGTPHWALPDIVEDGKTGLLVSERTAEALADGIRDAISDPERLHGMGLAAMERVDRVLGWSHVVNRFEQFVLGSPAQSPALDFRVCSQ